MSFSISMSSDTHAQILKHLFPKNDRREQGGFLFCHFDETKGVFESLEWMPLMPTDYLAQESDYLELSDEARAMVIKKAHDMGASLVELHCHPGSYKAAFSIADYIGFQEFVPHVRWRLKKRPYAALVFAYDSLDGFVWIGEQTTPLTLDGISTELGFHPATGISIDALNRGKYGKI